MQKHEGVTDRSARLAQGTEGSEAAAGNDAAQGDGGSAGASGSTGSDNSGGDSGDASQDSGGTGGASSGGTLGTSTGGTEGAGSGGTEGLDGSVGDSSNDSSPDSSATDGGDGGPCAPGCPPDAPVCSTGACRKVKQIEGGERHVCAVIDDGTVRCWGRNEKGQLGDGSRTWRRTPGPPISGLTDIAQLSVGFEHSCAVTHGGSVWCWGHNQ